MLSAARNTELYPEWLKHIESAETKDAFRYLVGLAAGLTSLTCHPQFKGDVRDFRFLNAREEQPFSFIPNKSWLLFYFRAPAVRSGKYSPEVLRATFESANENSSGEWTVRLHSIADVQRLWNIVTVE